MADPDVPKVEPVFRNMIVQRAVNCLFCEGRAQPKFEVQLMNKFSRWLYECEDCLSCHYPQPNWLHEAYTTAISELDTGILQRTLDLACVFSPILHVLGVADKPCLDFGGGLGIFARHMRDLGYSFYSEDPLASVAVPLPTSREASFTVTTVIEVLEHLKDPVAELRRLMTNSKLVIISTCLVPPSGVRPEWWYLLLDTGQHISLPSSRGLALAAKELGCYHYTDDKSITVISKENLPLLARVLIRFSKMSWLIGYILVPFMRRKSLAVPDQKTISGGQEFN